VTTPYQEIAWPNISGGKLGKLTLLITIKPRQNPRYIFPTQLCEQLFHLTYYIHLPTENCSEQTVDIMNPPVKIKVCGY